MTEKYVPEVGDITFIVKGRHGKEEHRYIPRSLMDGSTPSNIGELIFHCYQHAMDGFLLDRGWLDKNGVAQDEEGFDRDNLDMEYGPGWVTGAKERGND